MTTLHESMNDWMVKYKQNSVKPATYDRLITSFNLMKKYDIAYVSVDTLSSDDIQSYLNRLVTDGFALSTVKKQFNLLTSYLKHANVEGIVPRPIQNNVKMPSQSVVLKPKREVVAYDEDEQAALQKVFDTHEYVGYDVAVFMLETGARVGEALAVSWGDVNWGKRSIRINKTFVRLGNRKRQFVQGEAKSYTSNRTIPLSKNALALLKRLKEAEMGTSGFIFHDKNNKPLSYEAMRYQIKRACEQAKVPYYGQHIFRHTFATNCYHRGCDVKLLSKFLGHADVTITYNIYIHLFGDALEEMRLILG